MLSNRLSNRFDNRVNVCIHNTTSCQTRLTTSLTNGCIVYTASCHCYLYGDCQWEKMILVEMFGPDNAVNRLRRSVAYRTSRVGLLCWLWLTFVALRHALTTQRQSANHATLYKWCMVASATFNYVVPRLTCHHEGAARHFNRGTTYLNVPRASVLHLFVVWPTTSKYKIPMNNIFTFYLSKLLKIINK